MSRQLRSLKRLTTTRMTSGREFFVGYALPHLANPSGAVPASDHAASGRGISIHTSSSNPPRKKRIMLPGNSRQ